MSARAGRRRVRTPCRRPRRARARDASRPLREAPRSAAASSSQTAMSTSKCGRVMRAGVEVDRPAAEQPVREARLARGGQRPRRARRADALRRSASIRDERERRRRRPRRVVARRPRTNAARSQSGKNVSPSTSASISVSNDLVGERKCRGVDLASSDHEHVLARSSNSQRLVERPRRAPLPRARQSELPRDDDVPPPGKRSEPIRQRLPGPSAHDDGVTHRQLAEPRQVLRKPPGNAAVTPDDAAARDCGDERDLHTATGARIAGWCS